MEAEPGADVWSPVRAGIRALKERMDTHPDALRLKSCNGADVTAAYDTMVRRLFCRARPRPTTSTRKRQGGRRKHNGQLAKLRRE